MRKFVVRASVVVVLTAVAGAAFLAPVARSQIMAAPSYIPIGASASGSTSTVWFHEPSSRQVIACQTAPAAGASLGSIQCVTTKLP